jgi:hypothetical protein
VIGAPHIDRGRASHGATLGAHSCAAIESESPASLPHEKRPRCAPHSAHWTSPREHPYGASSWGQPPRSRSFTQSTLLFSIRSNVLSDEL